MSLVKDQKDKYQNFNTDQQFHGQVRPASLVFFLLTNEVDIISEVKSHECSLYLLT